MPIMIFKCSASVQPCRAPFIKQSVMLASAGVRSMGGPFEVNPYIAPRVQSAVSTFIAIS